MRNPRSLRISTRLTRMLVPASVLMLMLMLDLDLAAAAAAAALLATLALASSAASLPGRQQALLEYFLCSPCQLEDPSGDNPA